MSNICILKFTFFIFLYIIVLYLLYTLESMTEIKKTLNHFIANQPILFFVCIIILLVIIGTIAFSFVEWRHIFNAFYFTTITMSTVGYGDFSPITHTGKILSIIYWFMWAPLFIAMIWVILQSKFQKLVKHSIHAYHQEVKEAEKIAQTIKEETEVQQEVIKEFQENVPTEKKSRWKKILKRK